MKGREMQRGRGREGEEKAQKEKKYKVGGSISREQKRNKRHEGQESTEEGKKRTR